MTQKINKIENKGQVSSQVVHSQMFSLQWQTLAVRLLTFASKTPKGHVQRIEYVHSQNYRNLKKKKKV